MPAPMSNTQTLSADPTQLSAHFQQCAFARGPLHRLQSGFEAVHDFLAPRLFSSLVVLTILLLLLLPR